MNADFVATARDAVEHMRAAKSHSEFTKGLGRFMTALADAIEAPQLVPADRLAAIQQLGEQAVDQVEAHICSDRHAQKFAGSIYEINRRLELVGRWVQHYTQERHA